jgi:hypothetical protein
MTEKNCEQINTLQRYYAIAAIGRDILDVCTMMSSTDRKVA